MTDQKKTLKDYGVKDGDMVMMDRIRRQQRPAPAPGSGGGGFNFDFSQIQIPSNLRGFVVTIFFRKLTMHHIIFIYIIFI